MQPEGFLTSNELRDSWRTDVQGEMQDHNAAGREARSAEGDPTFSTVHALQLSGPIILPMNDFD
jgi:hypothetical protein